jgi:hypothetical protein
VTKCSQRQAVRSGSSGDEVLAALNFEELWAVDTVAEQRILSEEFAAAHRYAR